MFDLLLENSWQWVMYCKLFQVDSNCLEQDTYLINHKLILGTWLHLISNTFSNNTYSLLSVQDSQAIQACNCNGIRFKSVRWQDDV